MPKMELPDLPKSRPEIWRLAMYLHRLFSKEAWVIADRHCWYKTALAVHNEVYRQNSPYLAHEIPMEARMIAFNNEPEAKDWE